jgi:DNA polymerase III epsilon subunit-like protein
MSEQRQPSAATRIVLGHRPLILDTETTGLGTDAEIVEIGIIDDQGGIVFESLIKPRAPIPEAATAIHGIGNADVADALIWAEVHERVSRIIKGRSVAIYNAAYDTRLLLQTADQYGLRPSFFAAWCAMLEYAKWWGEWDDQKDDFKRQRLINAVQQTGIDLPTDGQAHRAIYDCRVTLAVMRAMAQ